MYYVKEIMTFIEANGALIVAVGGILGTATAMYVANSRGKVIKAVVGGVAASGNKAVMTIIKEEFYSELKGLARYTLSEWASRANKKQGVIKKRSES